MNIDYTKVLERLFLNIDEMLDILALSQLTTCKSSPLPQKCPNRIFGPKRCAMFWNLWKINFPIFIFWEIVDFVLKIVRKLGLTDFCEPDSELQTSEIW